MLFDFGDSGIEPSGFLSFVRTYEIRIIILISHDRAQLMKIKPICLSLIQLIKVGTSNSSQIVVPNLTIGFPQCSVSFDEIRQGQTVLANIFSLLAINDQTSQT